MPRNKHPIPRSALRTTSKRSIFRTLQAIEADNERRAKVLALEHKFSARIDAANAALPARQSAFDRFNTSPFVLLMYARQKGFTRISQVADAIVPAKVFSSLETAAGRLVEEITLPFFGWETVASGMHTPFSALDGLHVESDRLQVVTLKSGPRCLNDEMSENFADAILNNAAEWARVHRRRRVAFTYGVLYGTHKKSNKKDWHIARKLCEKARSTSGCRVLVDAANRWDCAIEIANGRVDFTVRIGSDWWSHLTGYSDGTIDVVVPLLRACVAAGQADRAGVQYDISDLQAIVSHSTGATPFSSALVQQSQIPWLLLTMRHFVDQMPD